MKKFMRRSVALMMMLTMILAATSTTFAAAKTKTVKKHAFSTSTSVINKSATKVKKAQISCISKEVRVTSSSLHLRPRHILLRSQIVRVKKIAATDSLRSRCRINTARSIVL